MISIDFHIFLWDKEEADVHGRGASRDDGGSCRHGAGIGPPKIAGWMVYFMADPMNMEGLGIPPF